MTAEEREFFKSRVDGVPAHAKDDIIVKIGINAFRTNPKDSIKSQIDELRLPKLKDFIKRYGKLEAMTKSQLINNLNEYRDYLKSLEESIG